MSYLASFRLKGLIAMLLMTTAATPIVARSASLEDGPGKPFVKWAGGKGQLLQQLDALLPKALAETQGITYVEPFVGGGAMLFHILETYPNISKVIANDLNKELIETYRVVRERPHELIEKLAAIQKDYRSCADMEAKKAYYLAQRARYNERPAEAVETAALFIFLNRTCFNGLYRVNRKGAFNVPFSRAKNPTICDAETILEDSRLLQKVEFLCGDFESVYPHIKGKAFVYLDPPYRPLPNTPSFTAYSQQGFNDEHQRRLAAFCRKLDKEGHLWLLSNSDPANTDPNDSFFDDLYAGFEIHRVHAARMINAKGNGRGKITELAIRNYKE